MRCNLTTIVKAVSITMTLSTRNTLFLSLLIASFCNLVNCAGDDLQCTTSEGQSGTCLALSQCSYVFDIVKKKGIQSREAQNLLQRNGCGFSGHEPRICCNQEQRPVGDRNTIGQQGNPNQNGSPVEVQPTGNRPKHPNPLSLLSNDCGLDESNRIIGGEVTALGEFPWTAILEYRQDGRAQTKLACGGTLITKRYVLTAAHCIRNAPSYMHLKNVRLGEHNVLTDPDCIADGINGQRTCADPMISVPIESVTIHESYNNPQNFRNDIALVRLAFEVRFTRFVKPICLPTSANIDPIYWAAGWGAIETRRNSDTKLKVKLTSANMNQCAATYQTKRVILGQGQMCAGGTAGKDTCKGDSGGPLMKQTQTTFGPNRWVIDGVVSIGHTPCGLQGWPGVYTKVHNYIRWILYNLEA